MSDAYRSIVVAVARALRVEPSSLDRSGEEALALSRAACQLQRQIDAEDERATALRLGWLRIADPTAGVQALRALDRKFADGVDPGWLRGWANPERPGSVLLLGLLVLIPEDRSAKPAAWGFLDTVARVLDVDDEVVHQFWGWLNGSADAGLAASVAGMLDALAGTGGLAHRLVIAAKADRERRSSHGPGSDYSAFRGRVRSLTKEAQECLNAMNVPTVRDDALLRYLESDAFRLTVLGEFKRGKSTFINAVLRRPELLPADDLPCTSGVIEIHPGQELAYYRREGPFGGWDPATADDLRRRAGDAHERRSRRRKGATEEARVGYWRIDVPEDLLAAANVSVVDTPGLGEDPARDRIARAEAERADAAILLMSTQQLASSLEVDLLERMRTKAEDVFIVVNYADQKPESEWNRLLQHVEDRLADDDVEIPRDRIVMLSAGKAVDELAAGAPGEWNRRVVSFLESLVAHLRQRCGAARKARLGEHVTAFISEGEAGMERRLREARRMRDEVADLAADHAAKQSREQAARRSLNKAVAALKDHRSAGVTFSDAFEAELPRMLNRVGKERDKWKSDHDPIGSPKKFAKEVGNQARDALLLEVERWIKGAGTTLLMACVEDASEQARLELHDFAEYVGDATGKDVDDVWNDVRLQALQIAFPEAVGSIDASTVVMGNVVAGVVSLILGYVIADIVLYYILGLIAGFLNPWLLAAAAVVGIAAYLFKGKDYVKGWVRKKIFKKIQDDLTSDARRAEIKTALKDAVRDLYQRHADGFEKAGQELLKEVEFQQREAERRVREAEERLGREAALRDEVARLERLASEAGSLLAKLRVAIA